MSKTQQTTLSGIRKLLADGERDDQSPVGLGVILIASVCVAVLYLVSSGSTFVAMAMIGTISVLLLTLYRLDWGFMLFVGLVLTFDQFPPKGYDRSIIGVEYFENLKSMTLFSNVGPAVANPLELHLLLIFLVWVILIATGKKVMLNRVSGWLPATLFFGWMMLSLAMGIAKGGDFLVSLWEIRALFYLGILFVFLPQIIQSRQQIIQMMWVIIVAIALKVGQGVVRLLNLGFDFGIRNELTSHEDPLFFVSLFVILGAFYVYRIRNGQRWLLLLLLVPMFFVFILAQRRATYGALAVAIAGFFILIDGTERKRFLRFALPVAVAGVIYLAAFWNVDAGIALPAKLVKSSISSSREDAGERYYSNLYRDYENYNLAQTFQRSPVWGIGFGNKYDQPIILHRIRFPLMDYIPHNEIFWIIVKTGVVGFALFWVFIFSVLATALRNLTLIQDRYFRTICIVTITAIMGQIVVSFFDLQLTYYRNMVFLGALMGLQSSITALRTRGDQGVEAPGMAAKPTNGRH